MSSFEFTHHGSPCSLALGETFHRPSDLAFEDTSRAELRQIIKQIESGIPWRDAVEARFDATSPWLTKIVTSSLRSTFFSTLVPASPGIAIDIGCGWGQMSRPLARAHWQVAALEPNQDRLDFVRASATQEALADQIGFIAADFLDIKFATKFDLALCIGVFEWVGAFQEQADPLARQRQFLRKVRDELAEGGHLVLGIENRLGLKYLLGCPDDHIGQPGVAMLPAALAARRWREESGHTLRSYTYTDAELTALLQEAGFTSIEFFGALPDYKLPQRIIPLGDDGQLFNESIAHGLIWPEHNGFDGSTLALKLQENLQATYASLAMQKIAHHFVPSFFVRAG